ncbi:MAG TPA: TRAP transporter small permease [Methylomirabilota bacterium]|nr:TRAP transporter small permease [Methylomirabilota bacterium]
MRASGDGGGGRASGDAPAAPRPPSRPDTLFPGRLGAWAGWVLGTVAATVLFAMMVLTFVDVTGRKLFVHPVYGAYEITEFLMGTLIFSALPLVTAREGHVTIDVLDSFLPVWFARWQQVVVTTISTAALAFVAWRLWVLSASHTRTHEVTMTLRIPHGPFSRLFAVMAALAAVASLVIVWGYVSGARQVRSASTGSGS